MTVLYTTQAGWLKYGLTIGYRLVKITDSVHFNWSMRTDLTINENLAMYVYVINDFDSNIITKQ